MPHLLHRRRQRGKYGACDIEGLFVVLLSHLTKALLLKEDVTTEPRIALHFFGPKNPRPRRLSEPLVHGNLNARK